MFKISARSASAHRSDTVARPRCDGRRFVVRAAQTRSGGQKWIVEDVGTGRPLAVTADPDRMLDLIRTYKRKGWEILTPARDLGGALS
jgi:hypothetical protein